MVAEEMPEIIIGKPSFQFDDSARAAAASACSSPASRPSGSTSCRSTSRSACRRSPGLEAVRSEARTGDEEVQVVVDRDRASQLGLTTEDVALTVAGAMRGDRLTRAAHRRPRDHDAARVPRIRPPVGRGSRARAAYAAGRLADRSSAPSPTSSSSPSDREIKRINRLTSVVITANLAKGTTLDEVKKGVEPIMNDFPLPPGYSWKFGRGVEENDKAMQTMMQNMLLAVVLIFLVMASLFESTLYPLSIITSILFAIVGVFWFLALTGTPMTFMAMIGIMILIGVVVNIGIVLVAHVIDLRASGMPRDAGNPAGRTRPAAADPDDDADDAARDAAARDRRREGRRRRRWRSGVLSDGARDHGRAGILGSDLAADRADVLRLVRRAQHLAAACVCGIRGATRCRRDRRRAA